jgi:L-asparaginase II
VEPISVLARRGDVVEARHRVHAVAVRDGEVLAARGDPGLVTFMRSSAKPIQALPALRACPDLTGPEIAIACASHLGDDEQLAAVRSLLARAGAREDDLECGSDGDPTARIRHNCSGKHAAMLLLCRERGWATAGYRRADHPVQQAMLDEVAAAAEVAPGSIATAVDGCGVVTFALPLDRMAHAFSRLERLDAGDRAAAAMRRRPELIRGLRAADTRLMRALPGWTAKGGAEGLLCGCAPDGTGVALKVEDGNTRAVRPALAAFLETLGAPLGEFARTPVTNSRGEVVGEIVADQVGKGHVSGM